jgi:hypothetical protein
MGNWKNTKTETYRRKSGSPWLLVTPTVVKSVFRRQIETLVPLQRPCFGRQIFIGAGSLITSSIVFRYYLPTVFVSSKQIQHVLWTPPRFLTCTKEMCSVSREYFTCFFIDRPNSWSSPGHITLFVVILQINRSTSKCQIQGHVKSRRYETHFTETNIKENVRVRNRSIFQRSNVSFHDRLWNTRNRCEAKLKPKLADLNIHFRKGRRHNWLVALKNKTAI